MEAGELKAFFERCYVVNLARREDRREWFEKRFAEYDWPFVEPQLFTAIDGKLAPFPRWWSQGGGAWGVYRSNLRIIEDCLMEGVQSVLILEDDATLDSPDDEEIRAATFRERVDTFLSNVPEDWQMVYLGGQHLFQKQRPPRIVNKEVVAPYNVNRLHAYGLSHQGLKIAYRHLNVRKWQSGHHVDHHFGVLHQNEGIKVYAPQKWLVGQGNAKSDICGRELKVRFWNKSETQQGAKQKGLPVVLAVVGPYRGGTSCVAGAIHHMGIIMGHKFFAGNRSGQEASPKGCFEAQRLWDICLTCYPEPSFESRRQYARRVELLRGWLIGRKKEHPPLGAKHPKLCLMIPEILEAWPDCKIISVHRDIKESAESLRKLGWWVKTWEPEKLINHLVDTRDRDLNKVPEDRVLHVEFSQFVREPQEQLEAIASFVGAEPSKEQYQRAVEHVDPELKHCDCSGEESKAA